MNGLRAAPPLLFLLCASSACEQASPPDAVDPAARELGRTYTAWLYEGRTDSLWNLFTPELRQAMGGQQGFVAFQNRVRSELGTEQEVLEEIVIPWLGASIYDRTATFSAVESPVQVQWTIQPSGGILAFLVQPAEAPAPSDHLDHVTRTPLSLPFSGTWFVYWGGRSVAENYHAASPDQRFAYDLLIVREGRTHAGDPSRNEGYFCFGAPVLAPAAGTVAVVEEGIPDNAPGEMNEAQPAGNYVVIDHGNEEYSFLAHLQRGSVAVAVGQPVEVSDTIGLCGNSGRSSEPHLHYHLQDTPRFGAGSGLPAPFLDFVADGQRVRRGEPTRGQTIARETSEPPRIPN